MPTSEFDSRTALSTEQLDRVVGRKGDLLTGFFGVVTFAYTKSFFNKAAQRRDQRRILVIKLSGGNVVKWRTRSKQAFLCQLGDTVLIETAQVKGYDVFKDEVQTLLHHVTVVRLMQ
ncbi:hypothetical protein [Nocardia terpenica]|uniref:Uncharacterized protein n=1 Tax=Nocardia terpenica TaxID=455432 RepID=A0A6G9ZD49_9NOCA|nr:hypothetical protein [Nocardia terpenica]QIS23468.1 hypothetical protein F6W96_39350 [Nocardia terpenica]